MKKYFPFDRRKFIVIDSRHNILHWLLVVLIRLLFSLIFIPLSFYLFAIGYALSADTIEPYLPKAIIEKVYFFSEQLPTFRLIKESIFAYLGPWYEKAFVWLGMVIGIPLMIVAISLFLSSSFSLYYTIFSQIYNRTHCPLCKEPIKIV